MMKRCASLFLLIALSGVSGHSSAAPAADYQKAKRCAEAARKGTGSVKKWDACLTAYNHILQHYPSSELADDALFAIAVIRHRDQHDAEKAKRALTALLDRYPASDTAPKAKQMLASLTATKKETPVEKKPTEKIQNPFTEPKAARRGGKASLITLTPERGEGRLTFLLEFDAPVAFTTQFIPRGKRTKSPAELAISIPHAQASVGVPKKFSFDSSEIPKAELQRGLLSGDLDVRFELHKTLKHKVVRRGNTVVVDFSSGELPRAAAKTSAPLPATKADEVKPASTPLVIVIDPGHGGEDVGAQGKAGVVEKDVVLAISKKLAKELRAALNAKVYLTRSTDKTMTLEERNEFATRKGADLFLSIHANASTDQSVAGIQTYYLNNATDEAAARLAARENRHVGRPLPEVEHILGTMLQNANTDESKLLAQEIQHSLVGQLGKQYTKVHDLKVRSALFSVLVGTKCPGVLIETSFISNPREERRLTSNYYQQHVAAAIRKGVHRFFKKRDTALSAL